MTAPCYSSSDPDNDFVFRSDEDMIRVKVRCYCGERAITNLRLRTAALPDLRAGRLEPTSVVGSTWCRNCKMAVKVTARALHLA